MQHFIILIWTYMHNPNKLNNGGYCFLLGCKIEAFSFELQDISSGSDTR